jgi:hypothetical protein
MDEPLDALPDDDAQAAPPVEIPDAVRATLAEFEGWLDGDVDAGAATPLATEWALPASGIDLEAAAGDARLYIDAYPFEGRIVGDLDQRAGRWLAERVAMFVDPTEHLPAIRDSIRALAAAIAPDLPTASTSIAAVADELDDTQLWLELALRITQRELRVNGYH